MFGEEYFEKIFSTLKNDEEQKEDSNLEENKYDKFFEGTEKLSDKSKYIKDFLVDNKVIGRKYYNSNYELKYIEVYKNEKLILLGISHKITFLHLFDQNSKKEFNENKFIGFRYYDKEPNQSDSKYFTLINRFNSKFYILEKNETMKDVYNKKFFDKELNCFSIIYNIIIQKYKNKNHIMIGETFPEIIGYCYGLISLNKIRNFIVIEPLIPEPFKPNTLKENITEFDSNIIYIEPLIYNGHISTILFSKINGKRLNIILDMSKYHTNSYNLNKLIFPKDVNNENSCFIKNPIQNYSSCCLWFYGEIDCLFNNENYKNLKSVFDSMKSGSLQFYIDVINIIGKKFYGINDLFKYEEKRREDCSKIDLNRFFIEGKKNYAIHKEIVFNQFLNLRNFYIDSKYFYISNDLNLFLNTEKILERLINYKNILEMNERFYEMIIQNNDIKSVIESISDEKKYIKNILLTLRKNYDIEFYKVNIFSYQIYFFNDIMQGGKPIVFPIPFDLHKKIQELDFNSFLKQIESELLIRKKDLESKYCIYSEEDILKYLNPSIDICFNIMNK